VLPDEVRYLFKIAAIKGYCRRANVEKVDAAERRLVITFRDNKVRTAGRLVYFIRPARSGGEGAARHEGGVLPGMGTPEERLTAPPNPARQLSPNLAENRKAGEPMSALLQ